MLLGAVIIFLPFLGFTSTWDSVLNVILGAAVVAIAYSVSPQGSDHNKSAKTRESPDQESLQSRTRDLPFVDHRNGETGSTGLQ